MKFIILVIFFLTFIFTLTYKSLRSLHMLQTNLYNENNRYLKWVMQNKNDFFGLEIIAIILSICGILFLYSYSTIAYTVIIIISFIFFLIGVNWRNKIKTGQCKKPLVITKRVKRLIVTNTILNIIPIILLLINYNKLKESFIYILICSLFVLLNYFVVFIAMIINMPVEKLVYLYYKTKAQNKLKSIPNLKIIGITGSYGKTSSKNILGDILNIKYNALPTPRNLNTYNGLIMTVNNHMDKFTDIFIAEMGAYVKGEIAGLCRLVKPKYGILTTIGTAHLESFGSEENIVEGKFELIESLPSDGFAILNGDDSKQVNYKLKNKVRTIWIGINNKDVDVLATNIKCNCKGTSFDVIFKGDKEKYHFKTKLLGIHNVYNILAAIACGKEFDIDINSLIDAVAGVNPIEHRLELKNMNGFYMIDDAYNSNPTGAKNACDVLGMMDGIKVMVTPGMIELGEKENEYNMEFGRQIAKVADYVILVGEKKTIPIKEGLLKEGYNKDNIIVINNVVDAYSYINGLRGKKDVYALFENDLPDNFNE